MIHWLGFRQITFWGYISLKSNVYVLVYMTVFDKNAVKMYEKYHILPAECAILEILFKIWVSEGGKFTAKMLEVSAGYFQ